MNDFIFQNTTKVYFGKDQMQYLPEEIARYGRKVLLVYGGGSIKRVGLYDKIMDLLHENAIEIVEFFGVDQIRVTLLLTKAHSFADKRRLL